MVMRKRAAMGSTPPVPAYPAGDQAKAKIKLHNLMLDYQDLVKETEAKKAALLKANRKKLKLLTEVKFLRRKRKSFFENPSLGTSDLAKIESEPAKQSGSGKQAGTRKQSGSVNQSGAGKQSGKAKPSARQVHIRVKNHVDPSTSCNEDRNYKSTEAPAAGSNDLLDLNKDAEELEEWQSLRTYRLNMQSMDSSAIASERKLPLCRDISNEASQVGKRKISWQDQLPLRV